MPRKKPENRAREQFDLIEQKLGHPLCGEYRAVVKAMIEAATGELVDEPEPETVRDDGMETLA